MSVHSSEVQAARPQSGRSEDPHMFRKLALSLAVGGIDLPVRSSRRGCAWRRRVRAAGLARGGLAGRKGAVRLGRPEVLLVQFGLARPGLVPVRLCVASRIRLGRRRRLAWLAPSGLRPSSARPQAAGPPPAPSRATRGRRPITGPQRTAPAAIAAAANAVERIRGGGADRLTFLRCAAGGWTISTAALSVRGIRLGPVQP